MADELLRSKHGFGAFEDVDAAVESGVVDEFDLLLTKDAKGKAHIGWVEKDGNPIFVEAVDSEEFVESIESLESEIASKATTEEVDAKVADVEEKVVAVETKVSEVKEKVLSDVESKIEEKISNSVEDIVGEKVEAAVADSGTSYEKVKYEFIDVPEGTLVDYREDEIRIMCPADTVFTKQTVGEGGDADSYYGTLKTFAPENTAGYIEHLGDQVDTEILTDLKIDAYGRKYQPTWLALAKCDDSGVWTYHGTNSTKEKYLGWDYQIDWYDADGVMISSDSIRINLSNEDCHFTIEPYYMAGVASNAVSEAKAYTDEQIAAINEAYAVVEF